MANRILKSQNTTDLYYKQIFIILYLSISKVGFNLILNKLKVYSLFFIKIIILNKQITVLFCILKLKLDITIKPFSSPSFVKLEKYR